MKMFLPVLIFLALSFHPAPKPLPETCLSLEEKKLYDLIMQYRASKGLPSIAVSSKLTLVAQTHVRDLSENYKEDPSNPAKVVCNPHSWSKKGKWTSCCYTSDHKRAQCMWDKPKEIAGYNSPGFEIAYYSSKGASAEEGLAGWKLSPGHNPLLINEGTWSQVKWQAIGIGLYKSYGVVWFGEIADDTPIKVCP
jgi:uncharacterized protein YkwD